MSSSIYKVCPKCSSEHQKLGTFCSRTCANSRGPRTDDFKLKVSATLTGRESLRKGKLIVERIPIKCAICQKSFLDYPSASLKKTTCKSRECIKAVCSLSGRVSASRRVKRSKQEMELFELCKTVFEDVLPNHIIADGWDADIVIPSLKLAIMWHGPWHYRDMKMSNHSLKQVQNRDRIKRGLFKSLGWTILEFRDCDYTPQSAFDVIDVIVVEGRGYAPLP